MSDVRYEAAFLRGALLVGLMHERDVHSWAESLLDSDARLKPRAPESPDLATTYADILSTPVEMSAMREALWPLAREVDAWTVGNALLTAVAIEPKARPADARVRMLEQIRWEFKPPAEIAAAIKSFENRRMFAAAGIETVKAPTNDELSAFLDRVRAPAFFHVWIDDRLIVMNESEWKVVVRERGPLPVRSRIPYAK